MKFDHQNEGSNAPASAEKPASGGGGSVQLKKSLRSSNYDEGRKLVSPDGGGDDETPGEEQEKAKVILSARAGGSPFTKDFWTELDVGHCWVDVRKPGRGGRDSWGFTAKNVSIFPIYQPWKSVEGEVLHPDGSRGASGTLETEVPMEQLEKGEQWAEAQGGTYNLFGLGGGHSCATFAKGFYENATGESAPTSLFGAIIASPNDLSASMNKKRKADEKKDPEAATVDGENDSP
jgi:hypothetical protein